MHRQNGVCEYYIQQSRSLFNKPAALIESQVVEKYRVCINTFFLLLLYMKKQKGDKNNTVSCINL